LFPLPQTFYMSVIIASGSILSLATTVESAELVSGTYETVGPGTFTLIAKSSLASMKCTANVGGREMSNSQEVPYTGTAGSVSAEDNVMFSQLTAGGKSSLKFTNGNGSTSTVDYILFYDPV